MKNRKVEKTDDFEISVMGIGTWAFDPEGWTGTTDEKSIRVLRKALDMGVNLIDTAPVYGLGHSEEIVGRGIKGYDRNKIFIATKCGLVWDEDKHVSNNLSRESLLKEIDEILTRLDTDYVDLLQVHWPSSEYTIEETFGALAEIKKSGKARYIGVSNYSLEDMKRAGEICEISSFQGLYNMLEPNGDSYHGIDLSYRTEDEILPYIKENQMLMLPYSPLMQGILAGRTAEGLKPEDVRRSNPKLTDERYRKAVKKIGNYAESRGYSILEVALNYLIHMGATSVIASMQSEDEVEENIKAIDREIPEDVFEEVKVILKEFDIK